MRAIICTIVLILGTAATAHAQKARQCEEFQIDEGCPCHNSKGPIGNRSFKFEEDGDPPPAIMYACVNGKLTYSKEMSDEETKIRNKWNREFEEAHAAHQKRHDELYQALITRVLTKKEMDEVMHCGGDIMPDGNPDCLAMIKNPWNGNGDPGRYTEFTAAVALQFQIRASALREKK
jgi:hypothetical protein